MQILLAYVDKYNDLSKSMSGILNSFEQRLGKLEQTIVPVYKETEVLQNRQKSKIEKLGPSNCFIIFSFIYRSGRNTGELRKGSLSL